MRTIEVTLGERTSCGKLYPALFLNRERKLLTLSLECFHLRSQSGVQPHHLSSPRAPADDGAHLSSL